MRKRTTAPEALMLVLLSVTVTGGAASGAVDSLEAGVYSGFGSSAEVSDSSGTSDFVTVNLMVPLVSKSKYKVDKTVNLSK